MPLIKITHLILSVFFVFLFVSLYRLQVIPGRENKENSYNNTRINKSKIVLPGIITDRANKVLACNVPSYSVSIMPAEFENSVGNMALLSRVVGLPSNHIKALIARNSHRPLESVVLQRYMNNGIQARFEENIARLRGVFTESNPIRSYPFGNTGAHVVGYPVIIQQRTGKLNANYQFGGFAGAMADGYWFNLFTRERIGKKTPKLTIESLEANQHYLLLSKIGLDIRLTIDVELQGEIDDFLGNNVGAVVVMDVNNGEILALASKPSFDPNLLIDFKDHPTADLISNELRNSLINRAVAKAVPPGSIIRSITAVAGLSTGAIEPKTKVICNGIFVHSNKIFKCHRPHGSVGLSRAIAENCNVYFCKFWREIGAVRLGYYFKAFGLGKRVGIGLPSEIKGIVPSPDWKIRQIGNRWNSLDTLDMAMGQGFLSATPLQMCNVIASISNGGILRAPHISTTNLLGVEQIGNQLSVLPKHLKIIRDAMRRVCSKGGTASKLAELGFELGGITGTSINNSNVHHEWFIGFAPFENPKVACCVLIESSMDKASIAVRIAGKVLSRAIR